MSSSQRPSDQAACSLFKPTGRPPYRWRAASASCSDAEKLLAETANGCTIASTG